MKKFLKSLLIVIVIICLICLTQKLDILDFSIFNVSEGKLSSYSDYYFNKLQQNEKEMYVRIDEAVKYKKEKVFLGIYKDVEVSDKVTKIITAYFYDNPEYYYISNQYVISIKDFKAFKYVTLQFDYIIDQDNEISVKDVQLETAVNKIIRENIKESMTDFEKEVAIHDALVQHVSYYEYEDINNIPAIKHTAYAALVEKEAVCDGYAKAFKILLEKVGIDSVIVSGAVEGVPHAWNMVSLDNEYYHVDVTSDKLEEKSNKYSIHTYFNITDDIIAKTHTLDDSFEYPSSINNRYDYYIHNGYYISDNDKLDSKLKDITSKQQSSKILEIRLDDSYNIRKVIDALYDIDFSNWRSSGKTSVEYNKIDDVYIFVK